MNIEHISVSRLQTFEQCHQLYLYKYHLKITGEEPEPFYFTYGSIIHKIAEVYVREKAQRPLNEVANDIINKKISMDRDENGEVFAPNIPTEYKKRMPEHLRSIEKLTKSFGTEGHLEMPFLYDLDKPNNKCVKGFIDRLIIKNDKYFIIDYKTSKNNSYRKNELNITSDIQLRTYARIVQTKFNVPADKIFAALCYLEGYNIIGAKFTEDSLQRVEKELLHMYNQIENKDPSTVLGNVGWHCKRCDYRQICPFFRNSK